MNTAIRLNGALTLKIVTAFFVSVCYVSGNDDHGSPRIAKLIDYSKEKKCFVFTDFDLINPLTAKDVPEALAYVKSHKDYTSYFLLLVLRTHHRDAYKQLDKDVRATIFCSALENTLALNDWSILAEKDSGDMESAHALLETGKVALKYLKPLLGNDKPALLDGSQESTLSIGYKYRRKDFAYRYASLILGQSASFWPDPKRRDKDIETLKSKLKAY